MKATAIAPSNIAFIKFFGKADEKLRLPTNTSISMCLSDTYTKTTVEFSQEFKNDEIRIINDFFSKKENKRIIEHLDRIRKISKNNFFAKVVTKNNFPKGSGIASSASGFAALTLACTKALSLGLKEKELSIITRLASGSACRSIPDGFVEWKSSKNNEESYAYTLYKPNYWDIFDILVIVDTNQKTISTSQAHQLAKTSPFFSKRIADLGRKIIRFKKILEKKNFNQFGQLIEEEALNMHAVMMTTKPPLFYFSPATFKIMLRVFRWRKNKLPVYFTLDAGPNVHLICQEEKKEEVLKKLQDIKEIKGIIVNKPSYGARLVSDHLF